MAEPVTHELPAFNLDLFYDLAPNWRGRVIYLPVTGSTNLEARRLLNRPGGPQELALVADKQTGGRGRLNRTWEAPFAAGLLSTLTLPLRPLALDRAYLYTAALALSVQQAAGRLFEVELDLKWPNDLLRAGRKCCGILAEIENLPGEAGTWLVLGFGVNTGLAERDLEQAGLTGKAANICETQIEPGGRERLLAATLAAFEQYRYRLSSSVEEVRREWAERLITVGRQVQIYDIEGRPGLAGRATGVDAAGGLLVQDAAGRTHTVQAGDVSVRLAGGRYA